MYLKEDKITFNHAIRETIARAGDTDTNAAIVGGMIGALLGKKGIQNDYIDKVLTCNI
jgi:ADP-ribosylglycohydrolase